MDSEVRTVVYDLTMREGAPPTAERVAAALGVSSKQVAEAFRSLADAHMLVLQTTGEILMAGPFSAVPTPFPVTLKGVSCYANCIWDALGIPAMLHADAVIDTNCADCGTSAEVRITDGEVSGEGFMHFVVPPRLWWSHIVYT